jgi:hypothetical protein
MADGQQRCHGCDMFRLQPVPCRQDSKIRKCSPCSLWRGSVMYELPQDLYYSSDNVSHKTVRVAFAFPPRVVWQ